MVTCHEHVDRGHVEHVESAQIYFEGDPFLPPNNGCTNCGSDDPARIIPIMRGRAELRLVRARA